MKKLLTYGLAIIAAAGIAASTACKQHSPVSEIEHSNLPKTCLYDQSDNHLWASYIPVHETGCYVYYYKAKATAVAGYYAGIYTADKNRITVETSSRDYPKNQIEDVFIITDCKGNITKSMLEHAIEDSKPLKRFIIRGTCPEKIESTCQ